MGADWQDDERAVGVLDGAVLMYLAVSGGTGRTSPRSPSIATARTSGR